MVWYYAQRGEGEVVSERLALLFYVQTQCQESGCRQNYIDNERYGRKKCNQSFLSASHAVANEYAKYESHLFCSFGSL